MVLSLLHCRVDLLLVISSVFSIVSFTRAFNIDRKLGIDNNNDIARYIDNINKLEFEEILLNPTPSVLERVREYEALKDAVKVFAPFMKANDEFQVQDEDENKANFDKRMLETIDKEDDWLGYEPTNSVFSSRRRLYPMLEPSLGQGQDEGQDEEEGQGQGQKEEELSLQMTKKDLESLIYQANPALTVHQLSPEPQISFRKNFPNHQNEEEPESSANLKEANNSDEEELNRLIHLKKAD